MEKNKKNIIIILSIIFVLIISLIISLVLGNKEEKGENESIQNIVNNNIVSKNEIDVVEKNVVYIIEEEREDSINYLTIVNGNRQLISRENLQDNDIVLGKYECTSDGCYTCYARQPISYNLFLNNDKVLLCEGNEKWVLYDYKNSKIESTFEDVTYSYSISKDNFVNLVRNNGKYALMNKEGNLITDYIYDYLPYNKVGSMGYFDNSTLYYGKKNYVVAGENDLKGVINASNGDTVIDFKYKDIIIGDNGLYSVLENDKWYLIDQKENKLLSMGYDYIMAFDFGVLVFEKEETNKYKVKLIDYNKQDLTNEIKINFIANIHQYYDIKKENDKIIISLNYGIPSDIFKYNITNNTLEFETGVY